MKGNPVFDAPGRFLHPRPVKPILSAGDREFLERFRALVVEHCSDSDFTTDVAAASVMMSRMHLNRKLRALTGKSTHEFIQAMRLEAARDLLPQPLPIEYIAASVGFKGGSHFAKIFREKFGATPTTYRVMQFRTGEPPERKKLGM